MSSLVCMDCSFRDDCPIGNYPVENLNFSNVSDTDEVSLSCQDLNKLYDVFVEIKKRRFVCGEI